MSASDIVSNIVNKGIIEFVGGTNVNAIAGTGKTLINGAVTSSGLISQNIEILASKSLNIDANLVGGSVLNKGSIYLTGENNILSNEIDGTGMTYINGSITTNADIKQNIEVLVDKSLTSDASHLLGSVLRNSGDVFLTAGDLTQQIQGTGKTTINGTVISKTSIAQDKGVTIIDNAILTINAKNLLSNTDNSGTLILTGNAGLSVFDNFEKQIQFSDIFYSIN